jgi:NADH:ubiquinone oxidoreductase subunit H
MARPGAQSCPIWASLFLYKALFLYWVIMWIKCSLPRIRIDQMLNFNWKFLATLSIVVDRNCCSLLHVRTFGVLNHAGCHFLIV